MNRQAAPVAAISLFEAARSAQPNWSDKPISDRLAVIRRLRRLLARQSRAFAATAARLNMGEADVLVAEVIPLLAACRFLEGTAATLLKPRRPPGVRPIWLLGTGLTVRRLPFGVILILAPRNYPLFLPAVQAIQALVAGNAVAVKPAPGCSGPLKYLAEGLRSAGLPAGLFMVLDDSHEAGSDAILAGADKVVLTGDRATGCKVLAQLALTVTPATMELSGDDALVVLPGAAIDAVANAICYGLSLNGGQTCIAPRRIIAVGEAYETLETRLASLLPLAPNCQLDEHTAHLLQGALQAAKMGGRRILGDHGEIANGVTKPLVFVEHVDAGLRVFGPAARLSPATDETQAVALANAGNHALGASVFGPLSQAYAFAQRLRAGCVVVNDIIVPTADPRVPFGGAGYSGFGVTRGGEGLLEMTRPQAVVWRNRPVASIYRPLPTSAAIWIARLIRWLYE